MGLGFHQGWGGRGETDKQGGEEGEDGRKERQAVSTELGGAHCREPDVEEPPSKAPVISASVCPQLSRQI
ncbi:hypothetical protein EYF80_010774 [Liparis tanakae]|uniref:Uncharacterized protein n=1 Tax=Liparis tanakae TaxID=230148 RepID=A0A4Z2IML2_9TELE|nr:hypothetical protein EYF80_010774 [Liparis tanakae]